MLKIAITGNIASGKSMVEKILTNLGFKTICADRISSKILEEKQNIIFKKFNVNSKKELSNLVFDDYNKKKELENILHPLIYNELKNQMNNSKNEVLFVMVPLLFEARFENLFDKIIFISTNENLRLERLIKRNDYSYDEALKRINAQIKEEEKILLSDFVIKNNGTIEELKNSVLTLLQDNLNLKF